MSHQRLGPGQEFDTIRRWLSAWGTAARDVGDDAAILAVAPGARLVVSTDASLEGVHFKRAWLTPHEVGYRACAASLSDLAAMGAAPLGVLVAVSVPSEWRSDIDAVMDGIGAAARSVGAPIIGGDTIAAGGAAVLSLAITVLGEAHAPLMRSGAAAGDIIYVTGALGGPHAALTAWEKGATPDPRHRVRFARPEPRIEAGQRAAAAGAHAAIDISDGLASDLAHLAAASNVAIEVDVGRVPVFAGATLDQALTGGEEYELLFAAPPLSPAALARLANRSGVPITAIGRVVVGRPAVTALRDGIRVALPGGYDHFPL